MFKYIDRRNHVPYSPYSLFQLSKANKWLLQRMSLLHHMEIHRGCVNTVVWDENGEILLSGSDDQHLAISEPWNGTTLELFHTGHRANIFSAKFLPGTSNLKIISCSGDGVIFCTDLKSLSDRDQRKFNCHVGTCYDILTLPSCPNLFLSCGEDGTVRWFDLRTKISCQSTPCQEDILLNMGQAVTAVALNSVQQFHLAVATQDSTIRIYDRRMLGTRAQDAYLDESSKALLMRLRPDDLEGKSHRVTSLRYNSAGNQVLASYSSDNLYLFDTQDFAETQNQDTEGERSYQDDDVGSSGPTLKRLRLRGDWSDTGPQAVPESELRYQAGDVGQARPTLHSALMQRMTDILSRMLQNPTTRATARRSSTSGTDEGSSSGTGENVPVDVSNPSEIYPSDANASTLHDDSNDVDHTSTGNSQPETTSEIDSENVTMNESNMDENEQTEESVLCPKLLISSPACALLESSSPAESISSSVPILVSSGVTYQIDASVCENNEATDLVPGPIEVPTINSDLNVSMSSISQPSHSEDVAGCGHSLPDLMDPPLSPDHELTAELTQNSTEAPIMARDDSKIEPLTNSMQTSISGIQNSLTQLRKDFRERYSVEPSVDLTYSGQGMASGVMTLGVGDEISRDYDATEQQTDDNPSPRDLSVSCSIGRNEASLPSSSSICTCNEAPQTTDSGASNESLLKTQPAATNASTSGSELPLPEAAEASTSSSVPSEMQGAARSRKRTSPDSDEPRNVDSVSRHRSASSRMARAIDKVVQRVRGEEARRLDGPPDRSVPHGKELQRYKGHRNARTMIKESCFWGDDHVMSGSDCGRVFVWEKETGRLVMLWEADRHVVNCLQPHPTLPVLATSGIDYDVKVWAPICEEPYFDEQKADEITRRNEALLAETRDTITVPATFMIRMLASLNQLRQDRNRSRNQNPEEDDN